MIGLTAWAHDFEVDGIYYKISSSEDLTVSVTYKGDNSNSDTDRYSGDVVIPSTVTYDSKTYSVTEIGERAFENCSNLISVTIPDGAISIGKEAFRNCNGLKSLTIPSVTSIGVQAFLYCNGLTSITIPSSVTSIKAGAFAACRGLENIIVDEHNKVYDSRDNCKAIIDTESNTIIAGCQNTTIPSNVTSIGPQAFSGCDGLTSITIPSNVTTICNYAFHGCRGITSVVIPVGMKNIASHAFSRCINLTSVTISESVSVIGSEAFNGCINLENIIIEPNNKVYDSRANCNAVINTKNNSLVAGCKNTTIPTTVTSIEYYAFSECHSLTSITIPNSVRYINRYAFWTCTGLTSITIPNSVTTLDKEAFMNCNNLKTVNTDNTSVSIMKNALGTNCQYIVPCTLYDDYVAARLKTVAQHNNISPTDAIAATCTTPGNSAYYTCTDCNKYFSDSEATTSISKDSWVISAKNHRWGGWTTTKAATCTDKGSKQRICANDASHIDIADINIDATNHLFTTYTYNNDATTEADGTETALCDHNCGASDNRTAEGTRLQTPTPVADIKADKQSIVKTVENGQLVIIRNGVKYDLMGRKL